MKKEIWKDVPNFEGYQASNLGRIRTFNKITYTQRHGYRHWANRILSPKKCYNIKHKNRCDLKVELWKDGKHWTKLVSRVVASSFYGESNLTVNHINGNSLDNRIENLKYVTLAENIRKGFETNLYPQTKIELTNKETHKKMKFRSLSQASIYMGFNKGYLSIQIKRNKFSN